MKTYEEYRQLIDDARQLQDKALKGCLDIMKERKFIKFDWEEGDAPSIPSITFQDDIADSYITTMWMSGEGKLKASLHAYYLCRDNPEVNLIADEVYVDWVDLLSWLLDYSDDME